jgi:hypothetical protein
MCYHCGEPVAPGRLIGFGETCETCGKDMHVCLACSFYAPGAHWDCRETIDSLVFDKARRNFCDWFSMNPRFHERSEASAAARKESAARSAFDKLFGEK